MNIFYSSGNLGFLSAKTNRFCEALRFFFVSWPGQRLWPAKEHTLQVGAPAFASRSQLYTVPETETETEKQCLSTATNMRLCSPPKSKSCSNAPKISCITFPTVDKTTANIGPCCCSYYKHTHTDTHSCRLCMQYRTLGLQTCSIVRHSMHGWPLNSWQMATSAHTGRTGADISAPSKRRLGNSVSERPAGS